MDEYLSVSAADGEFSTYIARPQPWRTAERPTSLRPTSVPDVAIDLRTKAYPMHTTLKSFIIMTATTLVAANTSAQTAREVRGPTPLIAIENEAPPKLIVDPPLPEPLSHGRVYIQYRTENLRIVPVFGKGALSVSPRIGHIHITVDDASWHFVDASGETLILVGLTPGPHKVLIELADPTHHVIASEIVRFTIPVTGTR